MKTVYSQLTEADAQLLFENARQALKIAKSHCVNDDIFVSKLMTIVGSSGKGPELPETSPKGLMALRTALTDRAYGCSSLFTTARRAEAILA